MSRAAAKGARRKPVWSWADVRPVPVDDPPPQPAPPEAREPPRPAPPNPRSICQWPIGDPRAPDFRHCAAPVEPGRPYCPDHCARAYRRVAVAVADAESEEVTA